MKNKKSDKMFVVFLWFSGSLIFSSIIGLISFYFWNPEVNYQIPISTKEESIRETEPDSYFVPINKAEEITNKLMIDYRYYSLKISLGEKIYTFNKWENIKINQFQNLG